MKKDRREFLQLTGAATAGLSFSSLPIASFLSCTDEGAKKIKAFGLQLYSVRDVIVNDPKGVLQQLASYGYKQIESYEGDKGMFWGMGHRDFKKYMDDLGMRIVASHCDMHKDFEKKVAEAAEIGINYLICPSDDDRKTPDDFKKLGALFNEKGEICRKNGIRFAFHNHDFTLKKMGEQYPQEILMDNTDPELVDFELDMYWAVAAGEDPEAWLKKYPNRFRLCHIKDRTKGTTKREDTCILGTGSIDYVSVLKTARKNGMQYFFAEQEHYEGTTPLKCMEANAAYLSKLKI